MNPHERIFIIAEILLIKLLIFLIGDIAGLLLPKRRNVINLLVLFVTASELHGVRHE